MKINLIYKKERNILKNINLLDKNTNIPYYFERSI